MIVFFRLFFFFKQKTAYEMRISDWSSDVCSSDLVVVPGRDAPGQSHGEDFPRIFPPFPIEVNLAPFLNGENPIPFLAGAETTRLPGEKSSPQLAYTAHLSSAKQYDKLTVNFGKFIVQWPAHLFHTLRSLFPPPS